MIVAMFGRAYLQPTMAAVKIKKSIAAILLIAFAFVISLGLRIWHYGSITQKHMSDVAIVLGAGSWEGKISEVFEERLNHAVALYETGYVRKIILTGGYGEGNSVSDAQAAKNFITAMGVPDDDILLEEKSTKTRENIVYARDVMKENGYRSALIVSDPLHMKRAMTMALDAGIEAYTSPTPTSRYMTWRTKLPFLLQEEAYYIGYKAQHFAQKTLGGQGKMEVSAAEVWGK